MGQGRAAPAFEVVTGRPTTGRGIGSLTVDAAFRSVTLVEFVSGEVLVAGAALHRVTGFSQLTCRRALRELIKDGVLVPGASRLARPRVAGAAPGPGQSGTEDAARRLSAELGARRRALGLTQPQLAELASVSVTTIGHAETGRLWQSRRFWECADAALMADGLLLELHDAFRSASVPAGPAVDDVPDDEVDGATATIDAVPVAVVANTGPAGIEQAVRAAWPVPPPGHAVSAIIIVWTDGSVASVHPSSAALASLALPAPDDPAAVTGPGRDELEPPP